MEREEEIEQRIKDWECIKDCIGLLDDMIADFRRLCEARRRLSAERSGVTANGSSRERADDAGVREVEESMKRTGYALDVKLNELPVISRRGVLATPDTYCLLKYRFRQQLDLRNVLLTPITCELPDQEMQNQETELAGLRGALSRSEAELRRNPEIQSAILAKLPTTDVATGRKAVNVDAAESDHEPAGDDGASSQNAVPVTDSPDAADEEQVVSDTKRRPCYDRDHLYRHWRDTEGLTPKAIRDRWNGLSQEEREKLSPTCPQAIGINSKTNGRDVVKTALKKADKEANQPSNREEL